MINAAVRLLPVLALATCVALAACGGSDGEPLVRGTTPTGEGSPRSFAMGLSSLPPELNEGSYAGAFELAGESGEIILIQRSPPWEELLAGGVSAETAQTTEREVELAEEHDLDLFVAIDPIDHADGIVGLGGLPPELQGADFSNLDVRQAFVSYAEYVAQNYKPAYLALGVEINSYQQGQPEDFERFVSLYHEAYDAVKALSPDTLVFPTFQMEELRGSLPLGDPQPPQWHLINRFEPRLDLFAVSSFPGLIYDDPSDVPDSYFSQLLTYTDRPIAVSATGFSSGTSAGEAGQADFLNRTLQSAQQFSMPFVVWFVGQDLTFTAEEVFAPLEGAGLLFSAGEPKEAWTIWTSAARRPLVPSPTPTAEQE